MKQFLTLLIFLALGAQAAFAEEESSTSFFGDIQEFSVEASGAYEKWLKSYRYKTSLKLSFEWLNSNYFSEVPIHGFIVPYANISRTEVNEAYEDITEIGADVLKLQLHLLPYFHPYGAIGPVWERKKNWYEKTNIGRTLETSWLTSYTAGFEVPLDRDEIMTLDVYYNRKYTNVFKSYYSSEAGVLLTIDLKGLMD